MSLCPDFNVFFGPFAAFTCVGLQYFAWVGAQKDSHETHSFLVTQWSGGCQQCPLRHSDEWWLISRTHCLANLRWTVW